MKDLNNIVLIGMPGAGKSTVGVILAKTIGHDFLDTDIVMSRRYATNLQNLVDKIGYEEFIKAESHVITTLQCENTVIATGGSVVLNEESMKKLHEKGTIIFLDVPFDEIQRRLVDIKTRGIAFAPHQTLTDMYNARLPLYKKYADFTIEVKPNGNSTEDVIAQILEKLGIDSGIN